MKRICENWGGRTQGGEFSIRYEKNYLRYLKAQKKAGFAVVHLTMYGIPIADALEKIKQNEKLVIVVGSEQVPREVYELADFNIAITNQPHSEVAALAITLDRLVDGKELEAGTGGGTAAGAFDFGGKLRIIPSERGKRVVKSGGKG